MVEHACLLPLGRGCTGFTLRLVEVFQVFLKRDTLCTVRVQRWNVFTWNFCEMARDSFQFDFFQILQTMDLPRISFDFYLFHCLKFFNFFFQLSTNITGLTSLTSEKFHKLLASLPQFCRVLRLLHTKRIFFYLSTRKVGNSLLWKRIDQI